MLGGSLTYFISRVAASAFASLCDAPYLDRSPRAFERKDQIFLDVQFWAGEEGKKDSHCILTLSQALPTPELWFCEWSVKDHPLYLTQLRHHYDQNPVVKFHSSTLDCYQGVLYLIKIMFAEGGHA